MLKVQFQNTTVNITVSPVGISNKKAQLMQRETRESGARLKAHCKQNLSSLIQAVNIQHDDYKG